jgi:hypothetical protein
MRYRRPSLTEAHRAGGRHRAGQVTPGARAGPANDLRAARPIILTIGHSTRALDAFIHLLQAHGVRRVVDVRTVPRSRHTPQFNGEVLSDPLRAGGIEYAHMPGLGGFRRPRRDSPNAGWRNAGFRGFADYMQTPEFELTLHALMELARHTRIALMCAEAVPYRCHRSLIADAPVVRGSRSSTSRAPPVPEPTRSRPGREPMARASSIRPKASRRARRRAPRGRTARGALPRRPGVLGRWPPGPLAQGAPGGIGDERH